LWFYIIVSQLITAMSTAWGHHQKKEDCVKNLFLPAGILKHELDGLPDNARSCFIADFSKRTEVMAIVSRFLSEIRKQIHVALTPLSQKKITSAPTNMDFAGSSQVMLSEASKTSFSMSVNGRASEEYRGAIQGVNKSGIPVIIKQVDIPPQLLGLSFDEKTRELCGVPSQAGEYELKVHFQFDPPTSVSPTLIGTCQLIINPDPKTLWKNLDSDKNDRYWKPDVHTELVRGNDGLTIIIASKRGRSHAHNGTFRDDDFKVDHDATSGWRIMTVADGAGSANKSREGSRIATCIATDSVQKALAGERGQNLENALTAMVSDNTKQRVVMDELYYLFGNAARETVQKITAEATSVNAPYKDFSTTLIITIHKKFSFGHFVAAYWVGDGGAGIYLKGNELNVLGKADSGEFAGQTRFLDSAMVVDSSEIMKRINFKIVRDFTAVVAMTDGITDPKFETDANFENNHKWDELWSELAPIVESATPDEALLDWLDFWSPGNHDDRTIGILCHTSFAATAQQEDNR